MKLYERFGDKGFHTTIITTFGIDFDAYENIVLPRLRGSGCNNNIVLADSRMLTYALDGAVTLPVAAGRHYSVCGATAPGNGVFHPKIILQLGRQEARLFVGSANVTSTGLAGNREIVGMLRCDRGDSGERRIVAAAWRYLERLLDVRQQAISHQVEWIRARTRWLLETEPAEAALLLSDGTQAAFLSDVDSTGIGSQFAGMVGERPVRRLVVISPYWDEELHALRQLAALLQPAELVILIDTSKKLFPGSVMSRLPNARVLDLKEFSQNRFVHAKAIIAQTGEWDHVLYGSANCTAAALGAPGLSAVNAEACLYRRIPAGAAIDVLNLRTLLESAAPIEAEALPSFIRDEPLPLEEALNRSPGRFECIFDTLAWWPSGTTAGKPELLGRRGHPLCATLLPIGVGKNGEHRFKISGVQERPAFARLRFEDGTVSALAVIGSVDTIRETVREARSKQVEVAVQQLGEETEEGLWLLEILDALEAAEMEQKDVVERNARLIRENVSDSAAEARTYEMLEYEKFIAGRRLRFEIAASGRHSFAGSELSLVRGFLNRVLSINEPGPMADILPDEADIVKSFDMGDETNDAQEVLERGAEFRVGGPPPIEATSQGDADRKKAAQLRATREQITEAVQRFNERIRARAATGKLTAVDLLRLRAVLTVVAAAGCGLYEVALALGSATRSSLQVLPLDGDHAWPLLMGRLLFTFFGGSNPAVRQLHIDDTHDDIPEDILECWGTCYWAAHACLFAAKTGHGASALNRDGRLSRLISNTYCLTGLRREELQSDRMLKVFEGLNTRFELRLGLDSAALSEMHKRQSGIPSPHS